MTAKLKYKYKPGVFKEAFQAPYRQMAAAAQMAVTKAGEDVKRNARAELSSSGLGTGFVNALRVDIYPEGRNSLNASAQVYHKIPYAGVFEEGATIRGKPRLWVPLRSAPQRIGSKRMTPKEYTDRIGPLQYVNIPGKKPLLFAKMKAKKKGAKVTLAKLRAARTATGRGATQSVPIFVGLDSVTIRKRLNVNSIIQRASNTLVERYAQYLRSG